MKIIDNKPTPEHTPICKLCGFHMEMEFGQWRMCKHQRGEEELLEAYRFVIENIRADYQINYSVGYEFRDNLMQEEIHNADPTEAESCGLFCSGCGKTEIHESAIEHALHCMKECKQRAYEKAMNEKLAEAAQERTDMMMDKAAEADMDAQMAQAEADAEAQAAESEQATREEAEASDREQEPPPDYGHDEPEDEPPYEGP